MRFKDYMKKDKIEFFNKRTNRHIELVQKYAKKIETFDDVFKGLIKRTAVHDASKFKEPEYSPYLYITWMYECKRQGKPFKVPKEIKDKMHEATIHHVKANRHHAEFHDDNASINKEDRDAPIDKIIDASKMTNIDIGEQVADWLAMSEEKQTNMHAWAKKNINVRWKWNKEQENLINKLIDQFGDKNEI